MPCRIDLKNNYLILHSGENIHSYLEVAIKIEVSGKRYDVEEGTMLALFRCTDQARHID